MAAPRAWERGDGQVEALTPSRQSLRHVKEGAMPLDEYFRLFVQQVEARRIAGQLDPGRLLAWPWQANHSTHVHPGDTILCCCAQAEARANRCHLAFAVPALVAAGWDVVFHGRLYAAEAQTQEMRA